MKRWVLTVLLQIDELISALFGGYANESISYRFALNAAGGGKWGCLFCRLMERVWPKHCDLSVPSKAQLLSRDQKLDVDNSTYREQRSRRKRR